VRVELVDVCAHLRDDGVSVERWSVGGRGGVPGRMRVVLERWVKRQEGEACRFIVVRRESRYGWDYNTGEYRVGKIGALSGR
jgi:hypothetical protein